MSIVRIFDESETEPQADQDSSWCMNDVKEYVKTYMVYDLQIKDLQESRREWSADVIKAKNLPKKELTQALSAAKKELDMEVVNDIYENISGICCPE
jgi:hypothetical protein